MDKPTFPKPRLIREDFLPEPMKDYRIKKETDTNRDVTKYYPQVKVFWWWHNLFSWNEYYDGFHSIEQARKALCCHIGKPVVEYIEFGPKEDCK